MLPIKSVIKKTLLFLINVPEINMKVQHILRLVDEHKQTVIAALKNINYLKIIDYGCGEGFFSDCFNQSKYYGYDPNINKIIYAKKKFINYKFLSESPDFRMFDLFFFNNVLHHLNPDQLSILINEVSKSTKENAHVMIIELKPLHQQIKLIHKLIMHIEASVHYSQPRPANFYKQAMQNNEFTLIDEKDMNVVYLLIFKK